MPTKRYLTQLGLTTILLCAAPFTHAKNVALLIGIADYKHADEVGNFKDLQGPKNDVEVLKKTLTSKWHFKPNDVVTLIDSQATHANILKELDALKRRSKPGDDVLIYFSGHGTSSHDKLLGAAFTGALSGNSGAIVPYDLNPDVAMQQLESSGAKSTLTRHFITGQDHFRPVLEQLDKDRHVTAIMDACFSGYGFRSIEDIKNNRLFDFPMSAPTKIEVSDALVDAEEKYPYQNVITIGSSSRYQPAADIPLERVIASPNLTIDNKPHGLFSDLLLRILNGEYNAAGADGILTYAELEKSIETHIANYPNNSQTPQFQPFLGEAQNPRLMNRPLFGLNRSVLRVSPTTQNRALNIKITDGAESFSSLVDNALFETVSSGQADFEVIKQGSQWQLNAGNGLKVLTTSDPSVLKNRIAAAHWLTQYQSKPFITTAQVSALPAANGNSFSGGDRIQIATNFDKPSALLVFNVNSSGYITVLYPFYDNENRLYPADQLVSIPQDDTMTITPPYGLDQMVSVTLKEPLSDDELSKVSAFFRDNSYDINSKPVNHLKNILDQKATSVNVLNIQTYPRF